LTTHIWTAKFENGGGEKKTFKNQKKKEGRGKEKKKIYTERLVNMFPCQTVETCCD